MSSEQSTREQWRAFWDSQAQVADAHVAVRGDKVFSDRVQAFHDAKLLELLSLKGTDRVLDAGCGLGDQVVLISPNVASVTAIDYSDPMVKRCRARLEHDGVKNAQASVADVTKLPFPDNSFDAAVSICVLQYLTEDECLKMFSEMSRVVKAGGTIVYHFKNTFSPTGVMIQTGRAVRALVKGRPALEYHYRPWWWYGKRLKDFGRISGRYSYGVWTPYMPKSLMGAIASLETKGGLTRLYRPFGKEFFYKVTVR